MNVEYENVAVSGPLVRTSWGVVRFLLVIALTALFVGSSVAPTSAEDCHEVVGRWPYAKVSNIEVDGDLGVVIAGAVLQVLDLADPAVPVVLGELELIYGGGRIELSGSFVYWIVDDGLHVIDISDPTSPVPVGFLEDTTRRIRGPTVSNGYLYVVFRSQGMGVIDVRDPTNPIEVAVFPEDNPLALAVSGSYAYLTDFDGGLRVLDIGDPTSPSEVGFVEITQFGWPFDIAVSGQMAFVGTDTGLVSVDVSDPSDPDRIFEFPMSGAIFDLAASNSMVYTRYVGFQDEMKVIDVVDPTHPVVIGDLVFERDIVDLELADGLVYVASVTLNTVDVSAPWKPEVVGLYHRAGRAIEAVTIDQYSFVASDSELRVFDIGVPSEPFEAAVLEISGSVIGIARLEDHVFLADYAIGLRVVDISDPMNPAEVGSLLTSFHGFIKVAVAGNFAYLVDGDQLSMIDISDPAAPFYRSGYLVSGSMGVAVSEGLVFVASWDEGLMIFTIDPGNVVHHVGSFDTPGLATDVAVVGDLAYLADYDLRIIDVSNPAAPLEIGLLETEGLTTGVAVVGNRVYAYGSGEVLVVDVSTPSDPVVLESFSTPGESAHVMLYGGHLIISDGDAGLTVVASCPLFSDGFESGDMTAWN